MLLLSFFACGYTYTCQDAVDAVNSCAQQAGIPGSATCAGDTNSSDTNQCIYNAAITGDCSTTSGFAAVMSQVCQCDPSQGGCSAYGGGTDTGWDTGY